jgi:hypothetical protein
MASFSGDQPGRLAHGPEEKCGRAGRTAGGVFVNVTLLSESTRRVGTAWPAAASKRQASDVNDFGDDQPASSRQAMPAAAQAPSTGSTPTL